jgi:hypothetical protein
MSAELAPLVDRLRDLAACEQTLTEPMPQEWPEVVERAYHVGRKSAFEEAARIAAHARIEEIADGAMTLPSRDGEAAQSMTCPATAPTPEPGTVPLSAAPPHRRDDPPRQGGRP